METNTHPYPALIEDESSQRLTFSVRLTGLCSPRGVFKGTREEWLEAAAFIMSAWIQKALNNNNKYSFNRNKEGKLTVLPTTLSKWLVNRFGGKPSHYNFTHNKVRYSCSLMGDASSGMASGGALAHCHYMEATGNQYDEIRMNVTLGGRKTKNDSCRVADILLHEMLHTCSRGHGHRGAFKVLAETLGLEGKMTSTVATSELREAIWEQVVTRLGKYPHKAVVLIPRGQRKKGSRLIKCTCPNCKFNFRTTRKWIDVAQGMLQCPIGCAAIMTTDGYEYEGGKTEEE